MVNKYREEKGCEANEHMNEKFKKKVNERGLLNKRYELVKNFLLFHEIDQSNINEEIHECLKRALNPDDLPDLFIDYLETLLRSSFWWIEELKQVIPEKLEDAKKLIDWHRYLYAAINYKLDDKYRFCGFSAVEDLSIRLTQDVMNFLVEIIPAWEGLKPEDVYREAEKRAAASLNSDEEPLDKSVLDGIDLLACIICLMRREGLNPHIGDKKLQDLLHIIFENQISETSFSEDKFGNKSEQMETVLKRYVGEFIKVFKTLGGAAGNQAYLYRQMGFKTLVHIPYHSSKQAAIFPDCAERLIFNQEGGHIESAKASGKSGDPRRASFVMNLMSENGLWPRLNLHKVIEQDRLSADRVIFVKPEPFVDPAKPWKKIRVCWKADKNYRWSDKQNSPDWDNDASCWYVETDKSSISDPLWSNSEFWPIFYLFQHEYEYDAAEEIISIELVNYDELKPFAEQMRSAMLGGIDQMGKIVFNEKLTSLLREALTNQLKALADAGANTRFEISKFLDGKTLDNLQPIFQKGKLKGIGINRQDLYQITSEYGSPYSIWISPKPGERNIGVYLRAKHLAKKLDVPSVFVHDPGLDILITKNRTDKPGEKETDKEEIKLQRHRQAMLLSSSAVPEALYRRANRTSDWSLVLSKQSMYQLLLFAKEYAKLKVSEMKLRTVSTMEEEKNIRHELRKAIEKSIREKGYWRTEKVRDFSVVVAPTILLRLPSEVTLAGAGDMKTAAQKALASEIPV